MQNDRIYILITLGHGIQFNILTILKRLSHHSACDPDAKWPYLHTHNPGPWNSMYNLTILKRLSHHSILTQMQNVVGVLALAFSILTGTMIVNQCSGSVSVGFMCFWASWIRILIRNLFVQIRLRVRIRILQSTAKNEEKPWYLQFSDFFLIFDLKIKK